MINGKGLIWADGNSKCSTIWISDDRSTGEDHKRQRKILLPGFGVPESKAFLSVFRGCAEAVSSCMISRLPLPVLLLM